LREECCNGWIAGISRTVEDVRAWAKRQLTIKGLIGMAILLYCAPPDWQGRNEFWVHHWAVIRSIAAGYGRAALIVVGLSMVWLDNRRLVKKRGPKPHDEGTLKGRTLKLRDEIDTFMTNLGPRPESLYDSKMNDKQFLAANHASHLWVDRVHHGFMLRFHARAQNLFHEFGEIGKTDLPYGLLLNSDVMSGDTVRQIVDHLTTMGEKLDQPS
jgi:hypothetical protein